MSALPVEERLAELRSGVLERFDRTIVCPPPASAALPGIGADRAAC